MIVKIKAVNVEQIYLKHAKKSMFLKSLIFKTLENGLEEKNSFNLLLSFYSTHNKCLGTFF